MPFPKVARRSAFAGCRLYAHYRYRRSFRRVVRIPDGGLILCAGRGSRMRRRGFTLIELVIVIGIIALLLGILLPALHAAKDSGHRTVCLANLHSIGQAAAGYLMANG